MTVQEIVLAKDQRPPRSKAVKARLVYLAELQDRQHQRTEYVVDKLTNECAETFLAELVASDYSWATVDAWYRAVFYLSRPDLEERLANAPRYTPAQLQQALERQ